MNNIHHQGALQHQHLNTFELVETSSAFKDQKVLDDVTVSVFEDDLIVLKKHLRHDVRILPIKPQRSLC